MKRLTVAALALTALLWSGASFASSPTPLFSNNEYTVGKGDLETEFSVDAAILRGDLKNEDFTFKLGGNYFITDIFAPGVEFEIQAGNGTNARFFPNLKAYWPLHKRILPYAQAGLGYAHVPGADVFDFGFGFSYNYLLSDTVAIGIAFRYDLGAGDGTTHLIRFPIGFHIYFQI